MIENKFDIKELYSGLFSDGMDRLGYRNQIISGFQRNQKLLRFMGRVRTLEIETGKIEDENLSLTLNFIDSLNKGDVLVIKGCEHAYFGEMMTRLCLRQGIEGVVIDGTTRDTMFTHDNCSLPIVAKGYSPQDIKGRGRAKAVDVPIEINGIKLEPGNLVFVDNDAVCVVPKELENNLEKDITIGIKEEEKIVSLINSGAPVAEILEKIRTF